MESVLPRSDPVIVTQNIEPLKKDFCSMLRHVCPFCGGNAKFSGFRLPPIEDAASGSFLVCMRCHGKWCPSCRQPRHKAKECLMFKYGQHLTGNVCPTEGLNKAVKAGQIEQQSPGDGVYTIEQHAAISIKCDNIRTRMESYRGYKGGLCAMGEPRQFEPQSPNNAVYTIEQNADKSIKHDNFRTCMESYRNYKGGLLCAIDEPRQTLQESQRSGDEVFILDELRDRSTKHDSFRTRMEYYRNYKGGFDWPTRTFQEKSEMSEYGEPIKVDSNNDFENNSGCYPIEEQSQFIESKEANKDQTEQKGQEGLGEEYEGFAEENKTNNAVQGDSSAIVPSTQGCKGRLTSTSSCPRCGVKGRCTGLYISSFSFWCLACKGQWCYFCRRPEHGRQKCARDKIPTGQTHTEQGDNDEGIRPPPEEITSVEPHAGRTVDGHVPPYQVQCSNVKPIEVQDHLGKIESNTDSRTPLLTLANLHSTECPHCGMSRYSIGSFIPSVLNNQSSAHYICLACNGKWELSSSKDRRNLMTQESGHLERQMQVLYLRELNRAPTRHFCPFCGMDGTGTGLFIPWARDKCWSYFICLNCNWKWCPFCKKYKHETLICAAYRAMCHRETMSAEIEINDSPIIPTELGQLGSTENRDLLINEQNDRYNASVNMGGDTKLMPLGELLSMGECLTCLETTSVLKAKDCDVALCTTCINTYMEGKIEEGATDIKCPGLQCGSFYHPDIIKTLIKPDKWKRFDYLRVRANMDPNRKACPLCDFILVVEDNVREYYKTFESIFVCPGCEKEWCFHCEVPWHENVTCGEYRTLVLTTGVDVWAAKAKQSGERNAQQCPKCKTWIEKTTGCDMMTCRECKTKFCYICGVKTPHPNGTCNPCPNPNAAGAVQANNRIHTPVRTYRPRPPTAHGARPPVHGDEDLCCCSVQ